MVFLMLAYEDFSQKIPIENLDYCHTFYIAGYIVRHNLTDNLYFDVNKPDFTDASGFDFYVHKVLPQLNKNMNTYFFYSPATAMVFAVLACLPLSFSLFAWQILSVAALSFSIKKIADIHNVDSWKPIYRNILFFPVVLTVLTGQANLGLGLLPLSLSYYFIHRNNFFKAGLMLGLVLLKPQYLPLSLLLIGAYGLNKNLKLLWGFLAGIGSLIGLTSILINSHIFTTWVLNFKIFDSLFSLTSYQFPIKLVSSLVACLLLATPVNLTSVFKIPIYMLAFLLSLQCLIICKKLLSRNKEYFPYVFILGIFIIPVISPHLLYYDLSLYSLAGVIIYGLKDYNLSFKNTVLPIWVILNLNALFIAIVEKTQIIPSLLTQILLAVIYGVTVYKINKKYNTIQMTV